MRRLGREVRRRRQELGFTLLELAARSKLNRNEITKIEYARCNPGVLTVGAVAHALRMRLSELIAAAEK